MSRSPHRTALLALAAALLAFAAPASARAQHHAHAGSERARTAPASARQVRHPDPRPGVTAAGVLPEARVEERARDAYRAAQRAPQVLDGIYCHCDCHECHPELHSLLDCFKSQMAANCGICRGQATLAERLHREGKTLEEIREAADKEHGP